MAYSRVIRRPYPNSTDASFMTLLSTAQHIARDTRKDPRAHMIMITAAGLVASGAIANLGTGEKQRER